MALLHITVPASKTGLILVYVCKYFYFSFYVCFGTPKGTEFKANKHLTDPKEIEFCIRLADTNLDTVLIQAEHLTRLVKDPNYQADI